MYCCAYDMCIDRGQSQIQAITGCGSEPIGRMGRGTLTCFCTPPAIHTPLGSGAGGAATSGRERSSPTSSLPPSLQIFFSDLSQDSAEDIFLTELKVKIQDFKFPKGEHLPPFSTAHPGSAASIPLFRKSSHLSLLNMVATLAPSKLTQTHGQPGTPEAQ